MSHTNCKQCCRPSDPVSKPRVPCTDLQLILESFTLPGGVLYIFGAINNGPIVANNVIITAVVNGSMSPAPDWTFNGNVGTISLGNISPGEILFANLRFSTEEPSLVLATAFSSTPDCDPTNNSVIGSFPNGIELLRSSNFTNDKRVQDYLQSIQSQ